jgi:hypothetical protein
MLLALFIAPLSIVTFRSTNASSDPTLGSCNWHTKLAHNLAPTSEKPLIFLDIPSSELAPPRLHQLSRMKRLVHHCLGEA